ncbi:hypothetical protein [Legionella bozemanae]|uniref:hypothetical protein n=1 Tax=Legionella bozemanae TaxID=447 RepID=UPI0010412743|nr:hypothetical protein [Legionella bozemanae]
MQEKLGIKRSIEICSSIAEIGKEIIGESKPLSMAYISNYRNLDNYQLENFFEQLKSKDLINEFSFAIKELIYFYPECPLGKLFQHPQNCEDDSPEKMKQVFKTYLDKYFYRRVYLTNLMEGTALYMGWIADLIKYTSKVTIPDLNALANYQPDEDIYEKASASVRATTHGLMKDLDITWCQYFWNRGLEIDECQK